MTCKGCIHKEVCYRRMDGIQETFANKCGDYLSDSVIEDIKTEIQKALDEDKATDTENAKVQAIALMWCLEVVDKHIGAKNDKRRTT